MFIDKHQSTLLLCMMVSNNLTSEKLELSSWNLNPIFQHNFALLVSDDAFWKARLHRTCGLWVSILTHYSRGIIYNLMNSNNSCEKLRLELIVNATNYPLRRHKKLLRGIITTVMVRNNVAFGKVWLGLKSTEKVSHLHRYRKLLGA